MAIIVGDIHGNVDKVKAFLDYKPAALHIALGDYLDSFSVPQKQQVEALRLLLDSDAVLLWGNHDLHYLKLPPWICTGFQVGKEKPLQEFIESNKHCFLAAYAVDGWLCTHGGVAKKISEGETDIDVLAAKFNAEMAGWLASPQKTMDGIFAIGRGRGGETLAGGIFWYDFKREDRFIAPGIKQIFGHTETREPVVTATYVALDTTNCKDTYYLFDTETNAVVELEETTEGRAAD